MHNRQLKNNIYSFMTLRMSCVSYMVIFRYSRVGLTNRVPHYDLKFNYFSTAKTPQSILSKLLNVSESKVEFLCLKHPVIKKLDSERINTLIETLNELSFSKKVLLEEPSLFGILPITIRNRYRVLEECGLENLSPTHLLTYLPIVKLKTIGDLKSSNFIPSFLNIENRLASYMTQWPTSLTTSIYGDVNEMTLHGLRLKITQRYLELVLDLNKEEFYRGINTYPTIKHRPLQAINETLSILQSLVMVPNHKIKNNLYLLHVDPENLKQIIYKFRSIGGIDIKEIIRMRPKLATKSYRSLVETRKVLQEYDISNEAQIRCFDVYTLGPDTVRERLKEAKQIPEFNTFFSHPRFLKMIHYKKKAMKRMMNLYSINKKCLSLNILSGSSAHFETFEKAPGDRLGKGKDLVFCISQCLGKTYSASEIRRLIRRHPYWINIPLVQVKFVYQKLSIEFTNSDIYNNCAILLYPWSKIKDTFNVMNGKKTQIVGIEKAQSLHEYLDVNKLNKVQKLSLALYLLEKKHYFTGNGVWTEEKHKNIIDLADKSNDVKKNEEYK